jgi:hypothetical protein
MAQGHFRDDLDVSGYIAALPSGAAKLRSAVMRVEGVDATRPYVAGAGPLVCSPSTSLVTSPQFSWDVNGYYRAFGFTWPFRDVTRKALRLAGHARRANASAWRVFALKTLLNPAARREYDGVELGERYLDPFEMDRIKGEAARRASAANAERSAFEAPVTGEDMLSEMGFHVVDEEDTPELGEGVSEVSGTPWSWSFYVWQAPRIDLDVLATWQRELIEAHQELRGEYGRKLEGFAVGITSNEDWMWDWKVEVVAGEIVFFVHIDSDTYGALAAMEKVLSDDSYMTKTARMKFTDEWEML